MSALHCLVRSLPNDDALVLVVDGHVAVHVVGEGVHVRRVLVLGLSTIIGIAKSHHMQQFIFFRNLRKTKIIPHYTLMLLVWHTLPRYFVYFCSLLCLTTTTLHMYWLDSISRHTSSQAETKPLHGPHHRGRLLQKV
jgi:hypothetical protein